MNGFQRRQEQKRGEIYQAALELFSKEGVQNVKIVDIATKAQVSPVTIYNYYGSKTGLLRQVVFQFMDEQYERYKLLLQKGMTFPQKIERIILNKQETAKTLHPEFIQTVMSKDPEIRLYIEDFYKNKAIPLLMEIIQEGLDEGYIEHQVSTKAILFYINMFWETLNSLEVMSEENKGIQLELVTLFFHGLMGKKNNNTKECSQNVEGI